MERLDNLLQEAQKLNTKLRSSCNGLERDGMGGMSSSSSSSSSLKLSSNRRNKSLSPSLITTPLRPLLSPEELVNHTSSLLNSPVNKLHKQEPLLPEAINQLLKRGIDIPYLRSLLRSIDEKGIGFISPYQSQGLSEKTTPQPQNVLLPLLPLSLNSTMEESLQAIQERLIFNSIISIDDHLIKSSSSLIESLSRRGNKRMESVMINLSSPTFKLYSSLIQQYNEELLLRDDKKEFLSTFLPKKIISTNKEIDPSIGDCWKLASHSKFSTSPIDSTTTTTTTTTTNPISSSIKVLEEIFYEDLVLATIKASPRDTWLGGGSSKSPSPLDIMRVFCELRLKRALQSGLHQELLSLLPQSDLNSPEHMIQAPPTMLAWHLLRAGFHSEALQVLKKCTFSSSSSISTNLITLLDASLSLHSPLGPDHPSRLSLQMEWTKETGNIGVSSDPYLLALMRMSIGMDYRKIRPNCLPPPLIPSTSAGILGPIQSMDDWLWMHLWNCAHYSSSNDLSNLKALQKSLLSQTLFTDSKFLLAKTFYFVGLEEEALKVMISYEKTFVDGIHLSLLSSMSTTTTSIITLLEQIIKSRGQQLSIEDIKLMFAYAFHLKKSPLFIETMRQLILIPTGATKTSLISYWVGEVEEGGGRRDGYLMHWSPLFTTGLLTKSLLLDLATWCRSRRPLDAVKLFNLAEDYQMVIRVLFEELHEACRSCLGTTNSKRRIDDLIFWKESSTSVLEWYKSKSIRIESFLLEGLNELISLSESISLYEDGRYWESLEVLASSSLLPLKETRNSNDENNDYDQLSSITAEADLYTQQRPNTPHSLFGSLLPEVILFTLLLLKSFKSKPTERVREILKRLLVFSGQLSGSLRLPEEVFIQLRNVDSLLF